LKAWKEKVTPQKRSDSPLKQKSEGLEAEKEEQPCHPGSDISCSWPQWPQTKAPAVPAQRHGPAEAARQLTTCGTGSQRRIHGFPIHGIRTPLGVSVLLEGEEAANRTPGHCPALGLAQVQSQ